MKLILNSLPIDIGAKADSGWIRVKDIRYEIDTETRQVRYHRKLDEALESRPGGGEYWAGYRDDVGRWRATTSNEWAAIVAVAILDQQHKRGTEQAVVDVALMNIAALDEAVRALRETGRVS